MFKRLIEYYKNNPEGYWFKRKVWGWGWTPATWQGWLVTLVWLALILLLSFTVDETSPLREVMFTFILPTLLLTITLIRICYKTGEKPRWQWGPPKDNKKF